LSLTPFPPIPLLYPSPLPSILTSPLYLYPPLYPYMLPLFLHYPSPLCSLIIPFYSILPHHPSIFISPPPSLPLSLHPPASIYIP
jgi:hypothetical protein